MAGALKVWDGQQWQTTSATGANQSVYVGPDPPPDPPRSGDLWYDTDEPSPLANVVGVANGGTGATTAAAARTNLGVNLPLALTDGGTGGTTPAAARTNLGVNLPLGLVDGGTGGTTAATARTSLAVPQIGQSGSTAGAPTSGNWARGDQWLDSNNVLWTCTVSGTPGTWKAHSPLTGASQANPNLTVAAATTVTYDVAIGAMPATGPMTVAGFVDVSVGTGPSTVIVNADNSAPRNPEINTAPTSVVNNYVAIPFLFRWNTITNGTAVTLKLNVRNNFAGNPTVTFMNYALEWRVG